MLNPIPITPADLARRHGIENAIHVLAPILGLAGPTVVLDLAARALHAGAEVSSVGVRMPDGRSLERYLLELKSDPEAAHFWRRKPEAKPAQTKPNFDATPIRRRATAKLDSVNGSDMETRL
ncbi:hypothetical protein [Brevundimonas sp. DWR2-3-1b1]|uniref:hypothetical protein n=1 Tax=unclassified Brevundimonas TaxID=2622653 RepID=UPI003CEA4B3E